METEQNNAHLHAVSRPHEIPGFTADARHNLSHMIELNRKLSAQKPKVKASINPYAQR